MIVDGKQIASEINEMVKKEIKELKAKYNQSPCLATVAVGDDEPSKIYVKKREKMCEKVGIISRICDLSEDSKEEDILRLVEKLNNDENIHGIIIQLPLPEHINEKKISKMISPEKDVDCLNPLNLGLLASGDENFAPCTSASVITMLEKSGIKISGSHVVIVGRSRIVGRPLALMLINRDATVTVCHTKTKNLEGHTKNAGILIAAAGSPNLIKENMVKENAVVVDVGINVVNNKIVGDVDFENVKNKASFITPVPGGVGPVTVAMIMKNALEAFKMQVVRG